ncbi:hypothetical protein HHL22_13570 [Hymenobacter sp. RP-2-7]|uniref:Pentapeptide MXKDX repeat protein n=1 Tax=Hymenobacter polaris TaxID=2682546 RepID=A0A7Y0AF33_9BACT|nr:hypothetical protein [Hymenobacter polaris]NML66236.1 hypothetical protein [Hymenobacter polaris]
MKLFLSLACGACLLGATAHAQSTMPAMGANTPKGEVAKTDASINPRRATTNTSKKTSKASGKKAGKMKMKDQAASSM